MRDQENSYSSVLALADANVRHDNPMTLLMPT